MPNLWQEFKAEYPAGKGADADYAWQIWRNLPPDEKQAAVDGLRRWKASDEWKDRRYIPSAGNFLYRQKWKETPEGYREVFQPEAETRQLTRDELFQRHQIHSDGAYHMFQRAQSPENYIYRKRGAACST